MAKPPNFTKRLFHYLVSDWSNYLLQLRNLRIHFQPQTTYLPCREVGMLMKGANRLCLEAATWQTLFPSTPMPQLCVTTDRQQNTFNIFLSAIPQSFFCCPQLLYRAAGCNHHGTIHITNQGMKPNANTFSNKASVHLCWRTEEMSITSRCH